MAEIIGMGDWRKRMRDILAIEIVEADRNPESDIEADRLLASLSIALAEAPLAGEEKLVALFTKLVEEIASIQSESERKNYADQFAKFLRLDVVEAARSAFEKIG
jgi:hypothetical protein